MGDIQLRGPEALNAVQHISMNDASSSQTGQAHYSAMLYPQGTFVDDVIVHKFSDNDYLIVINAGTREKDFQWVKQERPALPLPRQRLQRLLHPARDSRSKGRRNAGRSSQSST